MLLSVKVRAAIVLPGIFADNMVLQQQSDVAIWGWAKPNTRVKVTTSWNKKNYTAKSNAGGYWTLKVHTPAAGYIPYSITISDGKTIKLSGVLIGEVWVCSGQSNMEMPMRGWLDQPIEGGTEAINNSRNPALRFFKVGRVSTASPQDSCRGIWTEASMHSTPDWSATAYFFGRMLQHNLDVPVGLIHSAWGGSRIEAWMPPYSLKDFPEKKIPVSQEEIKSQNGTPTVLFNGMIHPLVRYGIRGAIWYQGESNSSEPLLYIKLFEKMVAEWRRLWGMGDFPFYYCQIAPYNYGPGNNSAYFREAQAQCMKIQNVGMAVLMDAESAGSIHPAKKKEPGERLALWALAKTYGFNKIQHRSPEVKSVEIEGRTITLTFDIQNQPGLTSYGKEIKNFIVAGEDKKFYPAKAAVLGNKIFLFSANVSKPVAVRYCFDNISSSEIFSAEGDLPVSSFRTDDWPPK